MNISREMIYEAVALAERFPDLSEQDVLDHINYVYRANVKPDTIFGQAILIAYNTQNENRGLDYYEGVARRHS